MPPYFNPFAQPPKCKIQFLILVLYDIFAFSDLSLPKEEYPKDAHFQAGSSRADVQANVSHFCPPGLHRSPTHNSSLTFINVYERKQNRMELNFVKMNSSSSLPKLWYPLQKRPN